MTTGSLARPSFTLLLAALLSPASDGAEPASGHDARVLQRSNLAPSEDEDQGAKADDEQAGHD
jgi:hypothetical protein